MDMQKFIKNRHQFPPQELEKYAGKYVAWSSDGTKIIASEENLLRLDAAVIAAGYDPREVVFSNVPRLDEVVLGGGGLIE